MKKFGKFLATTISLAALAGGTFYLVKHFLNRNTADDFDEEDEDDFDEEFDDFDEDDGLSKDASSSASREYVPINTEAEKNAQTGTSSADLSETEEAEDDTEYGV